MDGYDADFVDEVAEYLKCIVCHLVLRNPVLLVECGHRLCSGCFEKLKTHSDQQNLDFLCPHDRMKVQQNQVVEDRGMARAVLDLKVRCDHHDEGCQWVGELRNVQIHLADRCVYENQKKFAQLIVELGKRIESCEGQLNDKDTQINSLENELNRLQEELRQINVKQIKMEQNQIKGTSDKVIQVQNQIKGSHEKVFQVGGKENPMQKTPQDTDGHDVMEKEEMTASITKLDQQIKELQEYVLNVTEYIPNVHTVYEWTLKNYAYHQNVGDAFSPKFYSKLNGHCLRLNVEWFYQTKEKLGVYCIPCNDGWRDNSSSPFDMKYMCEAVNKSGESRTVCVSLEQIKDNQNAFTIEPGETQSTGFGYEDFLNMPSLTDYIQNDTLFIRCTLFHNPAT